MNKKIFIYIVFFIKYLILLNLTPELEIERYKEFLNQCNSFQNCLNPYKNIEEFSQSFLTFPYSALMFVFLLPSYFVSYITDFSIVNLTYLLFEIILISTFKKIYDLKEDYLLLIIILNPVIIYSVGILGQLDFIPFTFFVLSLLKLKENKKYQSIIYLLIAGSTKIIFLILIPIILMYFLRLEKNLIKNFQTIIISITFFTFFNFPLFLDSIYRSTVFFGINEGYRVVESATTLRFNSLFIVVFLITVTLFLYWKFLNRLDFYGVALFTGFLTMPIFISNLSNIGWVLWSMPSIILLYISFEYRVKILIYTFLFLLVLFDLSNETIDTFVNVKTIFIYLIYPIFFILFYYAVQALTQNTYFKIKSTPIVFSIAGDSATGKTTLSKLLKTYFGDKFVNLIELDSFHKYERNNEVWNKFTHLDPKMNNLSEFRKVILNLLSGKTQFVRSYNHLNGKFDELNKKKLKDFLIIEGLHSLHFEDLNKKYDMKIFIDVENELKSKIKIDRDLKRNKDLEHIKKEIKQRKADYLEFIYPQINFSDIYIKTIKSESNYVIFKILISKDYLYDLEDALSSFCEFSIKSIDKNKVEIEIKIFKEDSFEAFDNLASKVNNLQDVEFDKRNLPEDSNLEVLLKMGFVLFMLDKRIQTKVV